MKRRRSSVAACDEMRVELGARSIQACESVESINKQNRSVEDFIKRNEGKLSNRVAYYLRSTEFYAPGYAEYPDEFWQAFADFWRTQLPLIQDAPCVPATKTEAA